MHYELVFEEPMLFRLPFDWTRPYRDLTLEELGRLVGMHVECLKGWIVKNSQAVGHGRMAYRFQQTPMSVRAYAFVARES